MADKEGSNTKVALDMSKHQAGMMGIVFLMVAFLLVLLVGIISRDFLYNEETFTAVITDIDRYGFGANAIVVFNDGRIYDVGDLPDSLIVGHSYTLEYRTPYFPLEPSYLVIVDGG